MFVVDVYTATLTSLARTCAGAVTGGTVYSSLFSRRGHEHGDVFDGGGRALAEEARCLHPGSVAPLVGGAHPRSRPARPRVCWLPLLVDGTLVPRCFFFIFPPLAVVRLSPMPVFLTLAARSREAARCPRTLPRATRPRARVSRDRAVEVRSRRRASSLRRPFAIRWHRRRAASSAAFARREGPRHGKDGRRV